MSALRLRLFVALAVIAAAACVRLGFWQLSRLDQRRARNAIVRSRLDSAEVDVSTLPRDTALARFRRVRVTGTPDYDHELVLAARSRQGSPGVNIVTPVRVAGHDTAVLVNRGWVYSPDAATVDLTKWHSHDSAFAGYVDELTPERGSASSNLNRPRVLTRLTMSGITANIPYPVAPYVVVAAGDTSVAPDRPALLGLPALDEGPHFSYAIQWFGFALVALVGAGVVIRVGSQMRTLQGAHGRCVRTAEPHSLN